MTIVKNVLKYLVYAVILFIVVFFFWRFYSMKDPKEMQSYIWNQTAYDAYTADSDSFKVTSQKPYDLYTDSDGNFSVININYVKEIGQLQTTIRYNNSTVKKIAEKYGLDEAPTGEVFVYRLSDDRGNVYTDYDIVQYSKTLYNYRRLIFDGISFDDVGTLTLEFYYINDVDLSEEGSPFSYTVVYDVDRPFEEVEIEKVTADGVAVDERIFRSPAYLTKD